jgi:uncharacterized repeat protein (TIGR01451 family)
MPGRFAGVIAAALLTGAIAGPESSCAAGEPSPEAQPRIEVREAMPEWAAPGEALPIDVVISNTGTGPAENVTASSSLPSSLDLTEANPPPGRVRESLLWALGTLEPGGRRVLHLRVAPHAGATVTEVRSVVRVTYQASVCGSGATAVRQPQLALDVTGPEVAVVGEPVTLKMTIRNTGAVPARGVSLQTLLPAGLSHPGGSDLENEIGSLAAGETRQAALTVTPTQPGDLSARIRACAAGAEPAEREARLSVQETRLTLTANGPRVLYETWPGTFELALRNDGTQAVARASLAIALPDGLAFVRASDGGVYAAATHSVHWDLGGLRPGEVRTFVWNGMARAVGEQVCQVELAAGPKASRHLTWRMTVARAGQEPPAPGSGGGLAGTPPAPAAVAPAMAPPREASGPPSPSPQVSLRGGEGGAASALGLPPPAEPGPFVWRPSTAAPQQPQRAGLLPAASP